MSTPDPLILDRALANAWVVYTMDDDFLAEANRRLQQNEPFYGVIYNHRKRLPVGKIINDLATIAQTSNADEYFSRIQYLPLRK